MSKKHYPFTFVFLMAFVLMLGTRPVNADNVSVCVKDSDGNGIENASIRYRVGSVVLYFGTRYTGTDGCVHNNSFSAGTYDFLVDYAGTSASQTGVTVGDGDTVSFQTTSVTIRHKGGQVRYGGPGGVLAWFKHSASDLEATKELLPGTYKFDFPGKGKLDLTWSGPSVEFTVNALHLLDHAGSGLAGGKARGGNGANYVSFWVSGLTDANGWLLDVRSGLQNTMSYQMLLNNGGQAVGPQDLTASAIFTFETELVTLELKDCAGNGIEGGSARYGAGSNFGTSFFPGNNTNTSGQAFAEMFPGTYSFQMNINSTSETKLNEVVPPGGAVFSWIASDVTLHYSGAISYGGGTGDSRYFDKPTMKMLPGGTYKFHFRGGDRADLTIPACSGLEKTVVALRVKASDGTTGVPGVSFVWQIHGAPPDAPVPGVTGANGVLLHMEDGYNNNKTRYVPTYLTAAGPRRDPRPATESLVDWQLNNVVIELRNDAGALIAGASPDVYFEPAGGTKQHLGEMIDGKVSKDLMPVSGYYAFTIDDFNQTKGRKDSNAEANPTTVTFQTAQVTDSGCGFTNYTIAGGSWPAFNPPMQLLPGKTFFRVGNNPYVFWTLQAATSIDACTGTVTNTPQARFDGGEETLSLAEDMRALDGGTVPRVFELHGAYPNPFNPTTMVSFTVAEEAPATLRVFNTVGQEVARLFDGLAVPGKLYQFSFDARNLASGLYIYRLESAGLAQVGKAVLMK